MILFDLESTKLVVEAKNQKKSKKQSITTKKLKKTSKYPISMLNMLKSSVKALSNSL
jgi:hypothetical protein